MMARAPICRTHTFQNIIYCMHRIKFNIKGSSSTGNSSPLSNQMNPHPFIASPYRPSPKSSPRRHQDKSLPPIKYKYIMKVLSLLLSVAAVTSGSTLAQEQYPDYQDYADGYEQDDLYQNYANKQQEKAVGGG